MLVIASDAHVAAWAARPYDLGPGNEALRVWVLGPDQITPIVDPAVARESPDLAFLSALVHAITTPETLAAAFAGFAELPGDRSTLYYTILSEHLPAALHPTLKAHAMDLMKYAKTSKPLRDLARAIYRQESAEAAKLAAREQRRAILLRLMKKAGLELTDAQRRKVETCDEVRQLGRWIDRVLTAETANDVFATTRPKHSPPKIAKRPAAPRRARRAD